MSKVIDQTTYWGYVNASDFEDILIDYVYSSADFFDELNNFAIVRKDGLVGTIDKEGKEIIPFGKYTAIHAAKGDILYGYIDGGLYEIFDYEGQVIYTTLAGENIYNRDGILIINTNTETKYLDPITKQVMVLPEMSYNDEDLFFQTVDKTIDIKQDPTTQQYNLYRGGKLISDIAYDYVEAVDDMVLVGINATDVDHYDPAPRLGLIDEKGNILIDILYYDIQPLKENYFAVAEYYNYDMNYRRYSKDVYKKAIFKRTEAITGFDYYIVEPVKDDVFYVFDGDAYYFLDVATGEKIKDVNLEGPFKFKSVGDIIVATYKNYDGQISVYLKDWSVVKMVAPSYFLEDGLVMTKYKSAGINPVFYPKVALSNGEVEKKINDDLKYQFDTNIPLAEEVTGVYYETTSLGFRVLEYNDFLQITQTYFWYGLGAAHGNYGEVTFIYDKNTGEKVFMEDLFIEGSDYHMLLAQQLKDIAANDERLYTDVNALNDDELVEYFKRDPYNFKLVKEGLLIYYNPYDIGPYAAGIVDFLIPYESFGEDLKEGIK